MMPNNVNAHACCRCRTSTFERRSCEPGRLHGRRALGISVDGEHPSGVRAPRKVGRQAARQRRGRRAGAARRRLRRRRRRRRSPAAGRGGGIDRGAGRRGRGLSAGVWRARGTGGQGNEREGGEERFSVGLTWLISIICAGLRSPMRRRRSVDAMGCLRTRKRLASRVDQPRKVRFRRSPRRCCSPVATRRP